MKNKAMKIVFVMLVISCCWLKASACGGDYHDSNPSKQVLTPDQIVKQLENQLKELEKQIASNNDTFPTLNEIWRLVGVAHDVGSEGLSHVLGLFMKLSDEAVELLQNHKDHSSPHGHMVMTVKALLQSLREAGVIKSRKLIG
ncbi:hypothetical protein Ahia01_000413400 [Argonauta hians]